MACGRETDRERLPRARHKVINNKVYHEKRFVVGWSAVRVANPAGNNPNDGCRTHRQHCKEAAFININCLAHGIVLRAWRRRDAITHSTTHQNACWKGGLMHRCRRLPRVVACVWPRIWCGAVGDVCDVTRVFAAVHSPLCTHHTHKPRGIQSTTCTH